MRRFILFLALSLTAFGACEKSNGGFDGTVWIWGKSTLAFKPTKIDGLTDVIDIALGDGRGGIVRHDGKVWTWQRIDQGNFWLNAEISANKIFPAPKEVTGIPPAKMIRMGRDFTVVLDVNGGVWTWGANDFGQLGYRTSSTPDGIPRQVTGLPKIRTLAVGAYHVLAITESDRRLCTWGRNDSAQQGLGFRSRHSMPGLHWMLRGPILDVAAGESHSLMVVSKDGRSPQVYSTGSNLKSQLGYRTDNGEPWPIFRAVGNTHGARAVAAGDAHSVAIVNDSVVTWGSDSKGQLGDGVFRFSRDPRVEVSVVESLPGRPLSIAAGGETTYALMENREVWAWGRDCRGELGSLNFPSWNFFLLHSPKPEKVARVDGAHVIVAGPRDAAALILPKVELYDRAVRENSAR